MTMKPGEVLPVVHVLRKKYGELVLPNVLTFDLCLTPDREIYSKVTETNNDSGIQQYIMRTGYLFNGTKEELLNWFTELSGGETFFLFDRVFYDTPYDEGEEIVEVEE